MLLGAAPGPALTIEDLPLADGARVELLGRSGPLPWRREGNALRVELGPLPAAAPAHVLAFTGAR
jgi:hypothetical protein